MYEAYFHLQKRPFSATPDASCLYTPEPVQKVLDDLLLAARSGQGIGILTAAAGTGKTLICRRLVVELEQQFTPIFLANANFSTRRELLQAIHFELGRRYSGIDEPELRLDVISSLENLANSGRPAVLIVDEAHLLNERLLEELRSLANLAKDCQPLVRMILVGQMALEMRLIEPSLEALNQRIVCHGYLDPLTREQSRDYVAYRIQWAGGDANQLFDSDAIDRIADACSGLPRCLNQLCDHSLLLTFVQESPRVTRAIVDDALADLRQLPLHWNESLGLADEFDTAAAAVESEPENFDAWDEQMDKAESAMWSEPSSIPEPAAAIEIGGDETRDPNASGEIEEPYVSLETPVVPWTDVTANEALQPSTEDGEAISIMVQETANGVRVFREEFVEDRYASLDQRGTERPRTFEATAISDDWKTLRHIPVPTPPECPNRSDDNCCGKDSDTQDSVSHNHAVEIPAISPKSPCAPFIADELAGAESTDRDALLIEQTIVAPTDLEDEISNNVLDVFADVQNTLKQWWDPQSPDSVAGASVESTGLELCPASPYDIVEPDRIREPNDLANAELLDEERDEARGTPSLGRYVPRPNYSQLFSKLRRKAGRSFR